MLGDLFSSQVLTHKRVCNPLHHRAENYFQNTTSIVYLIQFYKISNQYGKCYTHQFESDIFMGLRFIDYFLQICSN